MWFHHGSDPRVSGQLDPVKKIRFQPNVPAEVRAIDRRSAITILEAIHRYAETGAGHVKPLSGQFEGLLRLRVGKSPRRVRRNRKQHRHPPRSQPQRRLSVNGIKSVCDGFDSSG